MVENMIKGHSIRFGRVLAVAFVIVAAGPVLAEKRPHPCDEPPTRPVAELRPLAEAGDSEAQYLLGLKYDVGDRFDNTWSEAASWFRHAAEQGHLAATKELGIMTMQGRGVPKDAAESLRLLRLAAGKGEICAQGVLGHMLMVGYYFPLNVDEAMKWLGTAAERELFSAHADLAQIYSGRFASHTDMVKSLYWVFIAEKYYPYKSDLDIMGHIRDEILPRMSTEEIAEAERRARDWLARHDKQAPTPVRRSATRRRRYRPRASPPPSSN